MGNLKLLACQREDAYEILMGQLAAFSNPREPFFFILFPEHETREKAVNRMLEWWLGDKNARYMKVVDEESGKCDFLQICHTHSLSGCRTLILNFDMKVRSVMRGHCICERTDTA